MDPSKSCCGVSEKVVVNCSRCPMAPPAIVQASKRRKSTPTRERINQTGYEVDPSGVRSWPGYLAASDRIETALLFILFCLQLAQEVSSASYLGNRVHL